MENSDGFSKKTAHARHKRTPLSEMRAAAFAEAVSEFINNNFHGAAEAESAVDKNAVILICAKRAAMLFKALLNSVFGKRYLKFKIESDLEYMTVTVTAVGGFPFDTKEASRLVKSARGAGFDILFLEDAMILTAVCKASCVSRIYACDFYLEKRRILYLLEKIFK